MERQPNPACEPAGERSLALVCHTWGSPSTFYSWVFMKQYLLVGAAAGAAEWTQ